MNENPLSWLAKEIFLIRGASDATTAKGDAKQKQCAVPSSDNSVDLGIIDFYNINHKSLQNTGSGRVFNPSPFSTPRNDTWQRKLV
jgi:hypothetical protein